VNHRVDMEDFSHRSFSTVGFLFQHSTHTRTHTNAAVNTPCFESNFLHIFAFSKSVILKQLPEVKFLNYTQAAVQQTNKTGRSWKTSSAVF